MYLEINGHDYSKNIQVDSYRVEHKPIYDKWTDAARVEHREYIRDYVEGSFQLAFISSPEKNAYDDFLNDLFEVKDDDEKITVTVYVGGVLNDTRERSVFYDMTNNLHRELKNGYVIDMITLKIKEA